MTEAIRKYKIVYWRLPPTKECIPGSVVVSAYTAADALVQFEVGQHSYVVYDKELERERVSIRSIEPVVVAEDNDESAVY